MSRAPKVTIGMPVYQSREAWLRPAFASLLAQDFGDFELIVADNASDEAHGAIYRELCALDPRARYVRHATNIGPAPNFNFVVAEARGDYFMWAADDDERLPRYLAETVAILDRQVAAASAGTGVVYIDDDGRETGRAELSPRAGHPRTARRLGAVCEPDEYVDIYALHRLDALKRTRLFRPQSGPDHLVLLELMLRGPILRTDEILFRYRRVSTHTAAYRAAQVTGRDLGEERLHRHFRALSRTFLESVLAADHLPPAERAACAAHLVAALASSGWLVADEVDYVSRHLRRAIDGGDYARAAAWAVPYLALRPGALVDPRFFAAAWRAAAHHFEGRLRGRPAP